MSPATNTDRLDPLLQTLTGRGAGHGLLELRHRTPDGMRSRSYRLTAAGRLAADALRLAERTDVYLGCGLRRTRHGGRAAIGEVWTLWADCDTAQARDAALAHDPPPTLVIASGSPGAAHAYWALAEPTDAASAEHANRRLAHHLGADPASTDAARILRPPGTHNHKHRPPRLVEVLEHRPDTHHLAALLAPLPADPRPPAPAPHAGPRDDSDDPLLQISPRHSVPLLVGAPLDRRHKTRCPLHEDGTPSLPAYARPEQGWFCFGCRQGGSVYDLAAALWRLDTRGRDFLRLRHRLQHELLP